MDRSVAAGVIVRPFRSGDLSRLQHGAGPHDGFHHAERSGMHGRGEATYLLARDIGARARPGGGSAGNDAGQWEHGEVVREHADLCSYPVEVLIDR